MSNKSIRVLLAISDLHPGSIKAILPPGFVTLEGQPIGQSLFQQWLWCGWLAMNHWLAGIVNPKEYAVLLNGDLIEGNHHGTKEIWSPENADHAKAATEILAPVAARAAKTFVVRGTECHVGASEIGIARSIGAEINPETQQPFWDRLTLDMCGVRISARHHIGTTSRPWLEAGQYSIHMQAAIAEAVRAGEVPPRILLAAHRHRPGMFTDGYSMGIVTGPWQGLTRHGFKVVPDGRPTPRVYLLDWRDKEDGELPEVHSFTPAAPEAPAVSI